MTILEQTAHRVASDIEWLWAAGRPREAARHLITFAALTGVNHVCYFHLAVDKGQFDVVAGYLAWVPYAGHCLMLIVQTTQEVLQQPAAEPTVFCDQSVYTQGDSNEAQA
jgi:hypothetical protein